MADLSHLPVHVNTPDTRILAIRGVKVILDEDLAELYGVEVRRLNEQVHRNMERFPGDFMFRLTPEENKSLRSQNAALKTGRGQHRKYMPYAFTEHGALMAASVLNSPRAVEMSVYVVRAFVRLREMLGAHRQLAAKLAELEKKVGAHDEALKTIIDAIKQLMAPPSKPKRKIGFAGEKTS